MYPILRSYIARIKELLLKLDPHRKKIGVLGPFSFGNLGNAALQQTIVQYLQQRFPDAALYGCCVDLQAPAAARGILPFPFHPGVPWPGKPATSFIVQADKSGPRNEPRAVQEWIRRTAPFSGLWKTARAARLKARALLEELGFCLKAYRFGKEFRVLIIGLGGVFDEVWGGKWGDLYSIFRWAVLARLAGARLVVLSVGVEEINTRLAKFFCKNALLLADYRSFRDEESKQKVKAIGVRGDNHVFPDMAFGLKPEGDNGDSANREARKVIGVSPMAYCDPRFWPVKNLAAYQGYLKKLGDFVSWLLRSGYEVVLFPTQIKMDRSAMEELSASVRKNLPSGLHEKLTAATLHSVDKCLTLLSGFDAVVTSRLHGVILSCVAGTPVLAVSPASKIDRLMEEMELTDYLFPIQKVELAELIESFQKLVTNRERIRSAMQRTVAKYRAGVEAQFELAFRPNA
jgi:polysaccharide pyruvyl transferase WcaK-like protein